MNTETDQEANPTPSTAPSPSLSPSFLHFLRNTEARAESMATKRVKSENTLAAIVATALEIAVVGGLSSISLGDIARRLNISKSGVFARVGSLEALQYLVLAEYDRTFMANVFLPAMNEPRGLPRLDKIVSSWVAQGVIREAVAGALHSAAAFDKTLDGTPLRQRLVDSVVAWRETLARTVRQSIDEGHLKADTDPEQLTFEISGLITVLLNDSRMIPNANAAERALASYRRLMSTYKTDQAPESAL